MSIVEKSSHDLIEEAQGLVRSLAAKIRHNLPVRVDLDDLIAYGQVGLVEAAQEYNSELGTKFTTYAYYRIRGAIYDGVSKMSWTSRARYNRIRYQQKANEVLQQEHTEQSDGSSTASEAQWLGNITEKLALVFLTTHGDEGHAERFEDRGPTPPAVAAGREECQKLHELVEGLPTPARRLIQTTYFEGATLQEAARRLGISKSWASRLHAKTLEQLARSLRQMGGAD